MELLKCSVKELSELISSRKLSSVELTRACLDAIDDELGAFLTLCTESALGQLNPMLSANIRTDSPGYPSL